jgi:transcriptional regulator with XRE-family HTH domain
MSLRDVEQQTGLSNGYLSLLEHDKVKQPGPPVLHILAGVFGLPYPQLMMLAGYVAPQDERHGSQVKPGPEVAFKGAEKLSPQEREEVQDFINFKLRRLQRARQKKADA